MDKREYQRVNVSATGAFYLKKDDELLGTFEGSITDISEGGVKIEADFSKYGSLLECVEPGEKISFQAMEEYPLYEMMRRDIVNGDAEAVHKELVGNVVSIGCRIKRLSPSMQKYVENRKLSVFIAELHGMV